MAERETTVGAAEGAAVGPVFVHAGGPPEPERTQIPAEAVEEEVERFSRAVEVVSGRLSETAERLRESGSEGEAGIFEAHVELGVTELSMSAPSIPRAKKVISEL